MSDLDVNIDSLSLPASPEKPKLWGPGDELMASTNEVADIIGKPRQSVARWLRANHIEPLKRRLPNGRTATVVDVRLVLVAAGTDLTHPYRTTSGWSATPE